MDNKAMRYDVSPTLQKHLTPYTSLWVKFSKPQHITYVGRDILCLTNGCQILLHNLTTRTEQIIHAKNEECGDGVSCVGGHKTHPLLAYAERREPPRVFLVCVTDLTYADGLRCNFNELSTIAFSDGELLFGLSGYPECSIVVWKWRTGEMMTEMHTGMFFNKNVLLKCGFTTQPIRVAQLITYTSELKIWEVACAGKKCILRGSDVTFEVEDPRLQITAIIWSNDGYCYGIDTVGNIFKYDFESKVMKRIIHAFEGPGPTAFCWWRSGLLIQGADHVIRHYDSNYEVLSSITPKTKPFKFMHATPTRDHLVVRTTSEEILTYDKESQIFSFLRGDETVITHFGLIPPQNELVVTLGKQIILSLWETSNGSFVHSITLDYPASFLKCNTTYPYIALTFSTGWLKLYAVNRRELQPLCSFNLTKSPLQEVRFFEENKIIAAVSLDLGEIFVIEGVPGGKFKVLAGILHEKQIASYIVVGGRACLKIFFIPVTSDCFVAGNKLVRYCVLRHQEPTMRTYELEKPDMLYTHIYVGTDKENRDKVFYVTPFGNKNLHELEIKRGDPCARIINRYPSHHMLRHIHFIFTPNYALSFGYDGIIILRHPNLNLKEVLVPHHCIDGGIIFAAFDEHNHRVITLGRDGLLICNELPGNPITKKLQAALFVRNEEMMDMFKTPTIGFRPKGKLEGVCWLEYKRLMKIEDERLQFEVQRRKIIDAFNSIQKKAVLLLTHNLDGPKNEHLELQDFNLNLQRKEDLLKASTYRCEKLKVHMEKYIQEQNRIAASIKEIFWDPIEEPTKNLWAVFGNFDVQSYAVLPRDMSEAAILERVEIYRHVESICAKEDCFKPWTYIDETEKEKLPKRFPKLEQDKSTVDVQLILGNEDELSEKFQEAQKDEYETSMAFFGSSVPLYWEDTTTQYNQPEIQSYLQQEWSHIVSMDHQQKLREYFNKEFKQCVQTKVKEMGSIIERNARLRYIISEMNYFSIEQYDIDQLDPQWKQDETPELITKVENSEVPILPYLSSSEIAILEANAAEEERIRLLLLADDFKERALMKMMNGVLEIRWEDELRREVPKPKCMIEKLPENFNEEDVKQIKDYEEQVAFLQSERDRYKSILQAEYIKVGNQLREGVKKFNDKVKELLVKKIQVDTALTNETLRINRMRMKGLKRLMSNKAEKKAEEEIRLNEVATEETATLVGSLNTYDADLKITLEGLTVKERIFDKQFKREFQDYSPLQLETLQKLYKKRPRANFKQITSPCTLQEMARIVASNCPPILLFGEPLEFIKNLDLMDKYEDIPANIDEATFYNLVRVRRIKIENELKIRSCQMEINEAESIQAMYQSHHSTYKDVGAKLILKLEDIRQQKVADMLNIELQLVLKQAYVELPRNGLLSDFDDAILINRKDVEDINAIILKTGARKIKAMRSALQFRKEIMIKEWQHKKMKMEITDLKNELIDIASIKVTKEIQHFLKVRCKGDTEKTIPYEQELEQLRIMYQRQINQRYAEVRDLEENLEVLVVENDRLNNEIKLVNIEVCEANISNDPLLEERERKLINMRIQANLKRSRLVNQIQDNHSQILVLQAELELCRLRTVPILDFKIYE